MAGRSTTGRSREIRAGDLNRRITFQRKTKLPDGYAGHDEIWEDYVTVWAQVEPLTGREFFYGHQIKNEISHKIRMRYRTDIEPEMRIKLNQNRYFKIEGILDLWEKHKFLLIFAMEGK